MKDFISFGLCVLALMCMPVLGCSSSSDGSGGSAGNGGSAGDGGSTGDGGSGGDAGAGGGGGEAGSGGSGAVAPTAGVWMGQETGGGGSLPICFIVSEDGSQLSPNGIDCQSFAIQVGITDCGSLWAKFDVDINEGAFEVTDGTNTITGTFDSATSASGSFTESNAECTGDWTATPFEE